MLKYRIIALATLFFFAFSVSAAVPLPETDKVLKDLPVTVTQSGILESRLQKTDDAVTKMIDAIKKIEKTAKLIGKVNTALKTTKNACLALEAIPQVKPVAHPIGEGISKFDDPVDRLDHRAKDIVKRLQPLKKRLQQFDKMLKKAIKGVDTIKTTADKMQPPIKRTANCIKALPAGKVQKDLAKAMEFFTGSAEPAIGELNKILTTINKETDHILNYGKELFAAVTAMRPVEDFLNSIWSKIDFMSPVLNEINKVLNYKISVPYSLKIKVKIPIKIRVRVKVRVKVKVRFKVKIKTWKVWKWHVSWQWKWRWEWQWQWKWQIKDSFKWGFKIDTKNFSFSINDILKGINTGISFVNDKLMSLAMKALNPILKKLHLQMPTIPGFSDLLAKLNIGHGLFDTIKAEYDHFHDFLDRMMAQIQKFAQALHNFQVKCTG